MRHKKGKEPKTRGLNRNDPCWCGSGRKYKACHERFDREYEKYNQAGNVLPPRRLIKSEEDLKWIREAAKINNAVLDEIEKQIKPGMSTLEIDNIVYDLTTRMGGIPAPLNYEGFPKSCCTSINEVICHGIPSEKDILKEGDIVNVDCTTIYHDHYADASRMFCIGEVDEKARKLVEVTKECMELGIEAVKPWGHIGDIGAAIEKHASEHGYSVVIDYCGHGVGNDFHEDPYVNHTGIAGKGMLLAPGMVFTIEPMINEGTFKIDLDPEDGWTARTRDGKLSAQWEVTLAVHDDGVEIIAH